MRRPLALPATFASLRHPNFRLFFGGQLLSLAGTWMQATAQQWLVVLLAAGAAGTAGTARSAPPSAEAAANWYLSLIAIAQMSPMLVGALFGGSVADRISRRRIILITQATLMLIALSLATLTFTGHIRIEYVVLAALGVGLVNVFDIPARQAFVVEMVGKSDIPNAVALNSSLFNMARTVGPAIAGVVIGVLGALGQERAIAVCFLINGVSYAAVLISLLRMQGDFTPKTNDKTPLSAQIREVAQYLKSRRPMLLLMSMTATSSLFVGPYFILLPSLARFTLKTDAQRFGFLMSFQGLGALAGALTIATLARSGRKGRTLLSGALAVPFLLMLLSFCRSYSIACLLILAIGFCLIGFLATANGLMQTSAPDHLRGRLMGIYALILMGLTPVGGLWAGAISRIFDAPTAIRLGAIIALLIQCFLALRFPGFRLLRRSLPVTLR